MNEPEREEIDNLLNGSFCTLCGSRNQDCGCDDLNTSSDEGDSVYDMTNNWVTAGGLLAPTNRFSNLLRAYFFMTKNNSIGDYYYQRWLQEGVYWSMCGLNQLGTHRLGLMFIHTVNYREVEYLTKPSLDYTVVEVRTIDKIQEHYDYLKGCVFLEVENPDHMPSFINVIN